MVAGGNQLAQSLGAYRAEEPHRIAATRCPGIGIDGCEQVLSLRMPRPSEVVDELLERPEGVRQDWSDGEPSECAHAKTVEDRHRPAPIRSCPAGDAVCERYRDGSSGVVGHADPAMARSRPFDVRLMYVNRSRCIDLSA